MTLLGSFDSLAVAFSGGVDSHLLLVTAQQALGSRVIAMTARSEIHPTSETEHAAHIARTTGVRHVVFDSNVMAIPDFVCNGPQRCYFCKHRMFSLMKERAAVLGIDHLAHGANMDDLRDYRPGFKAASELGVHAPLLEAGLTKSEIRSLARQLDLSTWDRPAMACLATRVPHGTPLQSPVLRQIERCEAVLKDLGIQQCRVRHHGEMARIEVGPSDMPRFGDERLRSVVVSRLKDLGFAIVCLDLEGYVSGKMNPKTEASA